MKFPPRRQVLLGVAVGVPLTAFFIATRVPYRVEKLNPAANSSLVITDRDGQALRTLPLRGGGRASWVPLDQIAPVVIQATLAGEDHRFYEHGGYDGLALARALWLTLRHGRVVSGGSTITMQLVRLVEPHPKTARGKLGEIVDACRLERAVGKAQILEQYLNRAYYGNGAWGIEAAARRYFNKPAAALTPGEGTLLAVLPRAPTGYDPYRHRDQALARRAQVLSLMEKRGWLDGVGRAAAEAEHILLAKGSPAGGRAPHFVDWVLAGLPPERRSQGGEVRTTLVSALQARLETAVRRHLDQLGPRGPRQAGVVVIDPATGAVLAMVGSADHTAPAGQVNITTTPRHPGSTLKPFVYALALENGASPATLVRDQKIPGYSPRRPMREHGPARYREALAGSYNLAAVEVLDQVGVPALVERLRLCGVVRDAPRPARHDLDLALGGARVRLVDLAAAYGFLVNGGTAMRARALADQPPEGVPLFSPQVSFLVMDMLADPGARRAVFGANLPLDLPFPVAAKTGTSSGFADTLTIAATREAIVAAWAGSFDGSGTKGGLAMWTAAPLARAALLAARDLRGSPLTLAAAPDGIEPGDVCALTGRRPAPTCPTKRELFITGTRPHEVCAGHP